MDKHKRYKEKCIKEGRCPHCGKSCAPYYECEERRKNKAKTRKRGDGYGAGRPRPKERTIKDVSRLFGCSYNKLYYQVTRKGFDFKIWLVKIGDRVELSKDGVQALNHPHHARKTIGTKGTVVGFARNRALIKIIRDGRKTPSIYHRDFWNYSN